MPNHVTLQPASVPTIVCVGRLIPEKNHCALLESFAQVVASEPTACLVLCGAGELGDRLQEVARQLGIASQVYMAGAVSNVWPHLQSAWAFASLSRREGLSLSVLEALSVGLPMVLSDIGAHREILGEADAAVLVSPDDTEAAARALLALLGDPARRERMSAAALQRARLFSLRRQATRLIQLYEPLVRQGSESSRSPQ